MILDPTDWSRKTQIGVLVACIIVGVAIVAAALGIKNEAAKIGLGLFGAVSLFCGGYIAYKMIWKKGDKSTGDEDIPIARRNTQRPKKGSKKCGPCLQGKEDKDGDCPKPADKEPRAPKPPRRPMAPRTRR